MRYALIAAVFAFGLVAVGCEDTKQASNLGPTKTMPDNFGTNAVKAVSATAPSIPQK